MKKKQTNRQEVVEVPQGNGVEVKTSQLVVSGSGKSFQIPFNSKTISAKVDGSALTLATIGKATRPKVALLNTLVALVKNTFLGISSGFSKKLQVVYSHFPVTVEVKGKEAVIKNFLGEKLPRTANIVGDTKVDVKGQDITVSGVDKYAVGQTANNLIIATKIKEKDRRIFQDGIYPVS